MALQKRDSEFRHFGVSYLDFKHVEMDRVLTGFLMRVRHKGQVSGLSRKDDIDVDLFVSEFLDPAHRTKFPGFADAPDTVARWIETHLLDLVNRGKPSQAVAGLRPLHGMTYKFRNTHHSRAYGADAQLYEMLRHARNGRGERALELIERFFFAGLDPARAAAADPAIDVETQALLHLDGQVKQDTVRRIPGWYSTPPLCIGQADLLADDVMRLLSLKHLVPRTAMVEYLKILFAFHLALGQLRAIKLLPHRVARGSADPVCGLNSCPADPANQVNPLAGCPFGVGLFIDAASVPSTPVAALSERNAQVWFGRIPAFVRAAYIVRKLNEFAEEMVSRGKLDKPTRGYFTVDEILEFGGTAWKDARELFFLARIESILQDTPLDEQPEPVRLLLDEKTGLSSFERYIELVMAYRADYHNAYIGESISSLLLKNRPGALLAQPRQGRRRFVADSQLLEVLVQIALLRPVGTGIGYCTRSLRLDEFLDLLRTRYGLYIDRLPAGDGFATIGIDEQAALRANTEAFTSRMREIGFYNDLSDAYFTQVITPRFVIAEDGSVTVGGR